MPPLIEKRYSYKSVPTIKAFHMDDSFIRGLMGPFGSGKSTGCVMELVQRAQAQIPGPDGIRRTRWAVIRNTHPQLRETTQKTFFDWLPPGAFGTWNKAEHTYKITAFKNCEIEVIFQALDRPDHVANLLSLELTGAWVNEAREIPWTIIKALRGRVGRYPAMRDGGCSWSGIFMDTNPPDNDSWWYKLFEEDSPKGVAVFKQPSGLTKKAENAPNLHPEYYQRMVIGMDAEWIKVYAHGEYGFVIDGKPVYPEYADQLHCAEFKSIPGKQIYRGWDFGLTPACVFTQLSPEGQWLIIDEVIADNMGSERFAEQVLLHSSLYYQDYCNNDMFVDVGDPAGEARAQTDERTCFEILHAKGILIEPGNQDPNIRIESVKKPLSQLVEGGKPALLVHPRCKELRKGFQGGYQYRRLMISGERFGDKPDKNKYSHIHDALQYVGTRMFGEILKTPDFGDEEFYDDYEDLNDRNESTGY